MGFRGFRPYVWQGQGMNPVPRDLEALLSGERSPQRAFPYIGDRWRAWVGHLDGVSPVLESLPPALDGRTTARLVEGLLPGNVAGASPVAMIWGHGDSGYGPYRTARVLSGAKRPEGVPLSPTVLSQLGSPSTWPGTARDSTGQKPSW